MDGNFFTNTVAWVAKAPFKLVSSLNKNTPAGVKWAAGGAALLAAGAALFASDAFSGPRGEKYNAANMDVPPLPPLLTPQDLALSSPAINMNDPIDFPDQPHAGRVLASRGQMLPPTQPMQSVISPEAVQDMGAAGQIQKA